MNLETFFEKFDLIADAPDAVAKMRELVLQLAVQGHIVSQSPNDDSAAALASTISEDRAAFVKARSLARQRAFDPVGDDQIPFDLPSGWLWTRLGNLCRVQAGFAFQSAAFVQGDFGVPMIRIRDITKDRTQVNYVGEYRDEFLVGAGDYLVGMDGNFTVAKWRGPRGLLNQRVSRLEWYSQHLEPSFFAIALQYRLLELQGTKAYTTVDHLSSGQIENAVVPLPPLSEQKRIVAKVDELMALCDRLETWQKERETRHAALARASLARFADAPSPANLNFIFHKSYDIAPADLRKSILTLAVQGKLVPQDPKDEPAEELLARIAERRTALLQERYPNQGEASTQLRKQEAQALPGDLAPLAPGWAWATLIQASLLVIDCHNKTAPYVEHGIRLLRTTNIRDGRLTLTEPKFVDDATYERWSARCKPEPGDILITREAPMGEVCIIPAGMKICLGQRMMLVRVVPGTMDTKYLLYSLMAPDLMDRVQDKPVGATVQHLRVGGVETLLTPVPPLAEQRRIVAKVDELMALVDALESQLATARTTAEKLMEAVVPELTSTERSRRKPSRAFFCGSTSDEGIVRE